MLVKSKLQLYIFLNQLLFEFFRRKKKSNDKDAKFILKLSTLPDYAIKESVYLS